VILKDWGRLDEAMALLKKSLQRSYVNQAEILQDWGRLKEAMTLLKMCRATLFRGHGAGSAAHYFVGAGAWGTA
jgi:hypothetical protein